MVLLAACTPARREVSGDLVRRVRFEGNQGAFSGQNDLQLRNVVQQKQSPTGTFTWPLLYFTTPVRYDEGTVEADSRRLESWYAHHGFFDARVTGWEVRRVRRRDARRAGVVDLIGHLDLGEPSLVESVAIERADGEPFGAKLRTVVGAADRAVPIAVGDVFDLDLAQAKRARLLEELQDNNYAAAAVELDVHAFPDRHAVSVAFRVTPGPSSDFGEIRIEGLDHIPVAQVADTLVVEEGEPFRLRRLRDSQQALFDTRLFSVVNVSPMLSEATEGDDGRLVVPIRVELAEARFRRVRAGGGLQFDYYNLQPKVTANYLDRRFAGSGLELEADAGVGAIIGIVRDDRRAPLLLTGEGALRFRYPWLLGRRLELSAGARFTQDAQFGQLPFWRIEADLGARVRFPLENFDGDLTLTAGPRWDYFQYLDPSFTTLQAARLQFGGDFTGAVYRLLAADAGLRYDSREDPLRPRNATFWALDLRQSIPIPAFPGAASSGDGRGFLYTKLAVDYRLWRPLPIVRNRRSPLIFAGRLRGTALIPWRRDDALPYPDLAFLGGPNSLRGFRANQVGPYDVVGIYEDGPPQPQHANGVEPQVTRTYLPRGGALALESIAEFRYDWAYGVSFAVFGEVGLLTRRIEEIGVEDLRYGGGLGARYDSPVGPIRVDLGMRPLFPEDFGAASYLGLNPIDRLPRGFDLASGSLAARRRLDERSVPVAFNLFLAIGEAF